MDHLGALINYAQNFIGVPYIYGGNNPLIGFDCSGFINCVLRHPGLVGLKEDLTAQGLYNKFKRHEKSPLQFARGDLLFYGKTKNEIEHVSLALSPYTVIEAGGGDRETTSREVASRKNAFVRESAILLRTDIISVIRPKYPWD